MQLKSNGVVHPDFDKTTCCSCHLLAYSHCSSPMAHGLCTLLSLAAAVTLQIIRHVHSLLAMSVKGCRTPQMNLVEPPVSILPCIVPLAPWTGICRNALPFTPCHRQLRIAIKCLLFPEIAAGTLHQSAVCCRHCFWYALPVSLLNSCYSYTPSVSPLPHVLLLVHSSCCSLLQPLLLC